MRVLILIIPFIFGTAVAQEVLKNESELGIATTTGNTNTESYTARQFSSYQMDQWNNFSGKARYLQSRNSGVESARLWEASLRYEKSFSELWSSFLQHQVESDVYSGYVQRNSTDIGAKYFITKTASTQWFAELGYRFVTSQYVSNRPGVSSWNSAGRAYSEANYQFTTGTSGRLWMEYIPNFADSEAYFINGEASVAAALSDIFSVKTSYLVKYQNPNVVNQGNRAYSDAAFLTSLLAKF